jgi:ribosomal protein S18 acetylase RimI-like enzyme
MITTTVKTAATSDEEAVVGALVLAFVSDPLVRWAFPDPHQYLSHFPRFVRAFGGKAFENQSAHLAEDCAGAALWLPPGVQPDETILVPVVERAVKAEQLPRVFALLEEMGRFHPTERHWYLPLIGVDPAKHRNGYGSTLLRHALQRVDQDHLPAYLESSNPANISLYERHGFEVKGTIEVETAPPMFPMYREAR